jgi:tetratricopeptide (TPR) repeat protein
VQHRSTSIALGPYQLLDRIGEGGSGQVYRARGPEGAVAVKVLAPASDMDDAARARFLREIGALGQITHPNLVRLIDHGIDPELGPYLVLPLLAGTNLRALCGNRAICPEAALLVIQPVAHATAALHAAGYVHRDLKPENAIAAPDGSITVIDLGLAWREGMTRHTDTGTAVGSVGYMAPEQIEGRTVDGRTDVWALGVILYEMIAGKRPFSRARPAEEAAAALLGSCPRLTAADRRASEELADLVARCLALDPARRPSAAELATAIDALIDWTDDVIGERAAAVADPVEYQARVAPFRTRRVERLAREAIEGGAPFAALAHCDRGLAYAPDHAGLLALVAAAEAATSKPRAVHRDPRDVQMVTTATLASSQRWMWIGLAAVLGVVLVAALVRFVSKDSPAGPDPWGPPPGPVTSSEPMNVKLVPDEGDRKLMRDFVGVFGKAIAAKNNGSGQLDPALAGDIVGLFGEALDRVDAHDGKKPAPSGEPTTASGWLELAATQQPAEAVASVRHALALNPTWLDAQVALCIELAAAKDDGAVEACETALRRKPDDTVLLGARGAAHLHAGDTAAALVDLDRAVAADPDPRWRRLRAHARTAAGDHAGAKKDLDAACQLGNAASCHDTP